LKDQFWEKLRSISAVRDAAWLLCGDFNDIRFKYEKSGPNFQTRASARFNAFLDRFLCSIQ
jgi:endonuclease/exonuclease/phosphatase family metal-dependent hydrolase